MQTRTETVSQVRKDIWRLRQAGNDPAAAALKAEWEAQHGELTVYRTD